MYHTMPYVLFVFLLQAFALCGCTRVSKDNFHYAVDIDKVGQAKVEGNLTGFNHADVFGILIAGEGGKAGNAEAAWAGKSETPQVDERVENTDRAKKWLDDKAVKYGKAVWQAKNKTGAMGNHGGFTSVQGKALFYLAYDEGWGAYEPNTDKVLRQDFSVSSLETQERIQLCQAWVMYILENGTGGPGFEWQVDKALDVARAAEREARLVEREVPGNSFDGSTSQTVKTYEGSKEYRQTQHLMQKFDPVTNTWTGPQYWKNFGDPNVYQRTDDKFGGFVTF